MTRRRWLLAAVIVSVMLLVPTGAVPFEPLGTDEIPDAEIELAPAEGPHGAYAVLNEDDKIELLLTDANPSLEGEGVPGDTRVPIDRVFTISYTGERYADVWIEDDAADVRFYYGDEPGASLEGQDNNVTLGTGETIAIGLVIDTRGEHDVGAAETFTVHAQVAEPTPDAFDGSPTVPRNDETTTSETPTETETETPADTTTETSGTPPSTPAETDTPGPTETETASEPPTTVEVTTTVETTTEPTTPAQGEPTDEASPTSETPGQSGGASPTDGTDTSGGSGGVFEIGGTSGTALGALLLVLGATLAAMLAIRQYR